MPGAAYIVSTMSSTSAAMELSTSSRAPRERAVSGWPYLTMVRMDRRISRKRGGAAHPAPSSVPSLARASIRSSIERLSRAGEGALLCTCPSRWARSFLQESPPNFSRRASASTRRPSPRPRRRRPARRTCRCVSKDAFRGSFVATSTERRAIEQRRDRLDDIARAQLLAVRDAALEPAGPVAWAAARPRRLVEQDLVVEGRARPCSAREPVADGHGLDGVDRHQRLGEAAVEPPIPLRERAEARGQTARDHLEDAAHRVAGLLCARRSRRSSAVRRPRVGAPYGLSSTAVERLPKAIGAAGRERGSPDRARRGCGTSTPAARSRPRARPPAATRAVGLARARALQDVAQVVVSGT